MGGVGVEGICGCGLQVAGKTVAGSEFQSLEVIGIKELAKALEIFFSLISLN